MSHAAGIDWGRRADWTVAARLRAVSGPGPKPWLALVDYARLRRAPWPAIVNQVKGTVAGAVPILSDATGVGDTLTDEIPGAVGVIFKSHGSPNKIGHNRLSLSLSDLFASLVLIIREGRLFVECQAPNLQDELGKLSMSATRLGRATFAAKSGHDDGAFALALAAYGATHTPQELLTDAATQSPQFRPARADA